jgi:hypothetical protein
VLKRAEPVVRMLVWFYATYLALRFSRRLVKHSCFDRRHRPGIRSCLQFAFSAAGQAGRRLHS